MPVLRLNIRVRPGASRTAVGGRYGDDGDILVIAVNAPPVDGAANEAVTRAIAKAFGVRPRQVAIVSGHQGRSKIVDLDVEDSDAATARLRELLEA